MLSTFLFMPVAPQLGGHTGLKPSYLNDAAEAEAILYFPENANRYKTDALNS
jgi:hypothetical protein